MNLDAPTVTIILAFIALIVWLVRMEAKTNATANKHEELAEDTYAHIGDKDSHADKQATDLKFAVLNAAVNDVKHLVEKLDERLRRFLEK